MKTRLMVALLCMGLFSGGLLRPAFASYCTAADVESMDYAGYSIGEIRQNCSVMDVSRCSVDQVFTMIDQGYSLSDIYYSCG